MLQNLRTSTWFLSGILLGLSLAVRHSVYALKDDDKQIPFEDLCGCLDKTALCKALPEQYRRTIAEAMDEAHLNAGDTVFSEGDASDAVYIVHEGTVSIRKGDQELTKVGAGGEFGEMAAISQEPRAATVVAETDVVCGTLSSAEFQELVRAEPDIALHLARVFASRLQG